MDDKIIIFTEGGHDFGYGHVTRCIALYDELKKIGMDPLFVLNGDIELENLLENRKFILDCNWYNENRTHKYLLNNPYSIVDSYVANESTCNDICKGSKKVLFIDDYQRILYPEGIVVNPSIIGDNLDYDYDNKHKYLLGSSYVILRKEFHEVFDRKINKKIQDIFIMMGGTDTKNLTPEIIKILNTISLDFKKHIVLGNGTKNIDLIMNESDENTKIYQNLNAFALKQLMEKCDIAITTAGQTIYELISARLPFVCIKIADNQEYNIKGLLEKKIIFDYINLENSGWDKHVIEQIRHLESLNSRKEILSNMSKVIDGKGTERIIKEFISQ